MDLDLRLVRYFVAVAEELHFGRAATRLFISQPSLSKQVQKLEGQLGAPLLVRDSRHVGLTGFGETFLVDAPELLRLAQRMQQPADSRQVRVAHVFELSTSREVVDHYARARPDVQLVQHAMHSTAQLGALLAGRLDVAILRVTAQMLREHPTGWSHRLLRLEPMRLVSRAGGPGRRVSLRERPLEVFGDPPGSGLYNAYGDYLTALERHTGLPMRWLGTPGAFSHCLAAVQRSDGSAQLLEFDSYATRYDQEGLSVHDPAELQPYYPWSLAWCDGGLSQAGTDLLEVAEDIAERQGWRDGWATGDVPPWLPADDPALAEVPAGVPA